MLKSSESIAALAAALARAQQELTNPEKSLTATLPAASAREEARTYRYASLATGLDIVRKSLGRQEIAAVQSTVIDQQTGLVRLVTVLAHSSGEWLSSEWPVCPITETANPQRMGAALTYARRYALFTLVGIAGEDDLDAPEPSRPTAASTNGRSSAPEAAPISAQRRPMPARSQTNGSRPPPAQHDQILPPEDSQALREALFAELALIQSTDGLTRWAHRRLRSKNILQDADAHTVEKAFQAKIDAASESATAAANELEPAAVANDPHAPNSPSGEQRIEAQPPPQADASGNTPPPQDGTTDTSAARRRAARKNRQRGGEEPQPNASASASGAEASNANGDVPALQGSSLGKPAPPPVGSDLSRSERLSASVGHTASTRACSIWTNPGAFATRSTSDTSHRSRVSSAASDPPMPITFASPNRELSVAR